MAAAADNAKALKVLRDASDERVKTIRTRAEKWIPGLTAVVGLVSVALIIKGPDSFAKITGRTAFTWGPLPDQLVFDTKDVVAWLIGIALGLLVVGTYCAYSAAFGSALSPDTLKENPFNTLAVRLADWRTKTEGKVRRRLRVALFGSLLATLLLACSVWLATFSPASGAASSVCLYRDSELILKGPAPLQVESMPEGSRIEVC